MRRRKRSFLPRFILKVMILPRQARDERSEKPLKQDGFLRFFLRLGLLKVATQHNPAGAPMVYIYRSTADAFLGITNAPEGAVRCGHTTFVASRRFLMETAMACQDRLGTRERETQQQEAFPQDIAQIGVMMTWMVDDVTATATVSKHKARKRTFLGALFTLKI